MPLKVKTDGKSKKIDSKPNNEPVLSKVGSNMRVITTFSGEKRGDLSIKVGDQVKIIKIVDENWYEGSLKGKTGIFPSKFVI